MKPHESEQQKPISASTNSIIIPLAPSPHEAEEEKDMFNKLLQPGGQVHSDQFTVLTLAMHYISQYLPDVNFVKYTGHYDNAIDLVKFFQNTDFSQHRYTFTLIPHTLGFLGITIDSQSKFVIMKRNFGGSHYKVQFKFNDFSTETKNIVKVTLGEILNNYLPQYTLTGLVSGMHRNLLEQLCFDILQTLDYQIEISNNAITLNKIENPIKTLSFYKNNELFKPLKQGAECVKFKKLLHRAAQYNQEKNFVKTGKLESLESRAKKVLAQAPINFFKQALAAPLYNRLETDEDWQMYYRRNLMGNISKSKLTSKHKAKCEHYHQAILQPAINSAHQILHIDTKYHLLLQVWLQFRALCYLNDLEQVTKYLHAMQAADIHLDVLMLLSPEDGSTLLHLLFANNQQSILAKILSFYPKLFLTLQDKKGSASPLDNAIFAGNLDLVKDNLPSHISEEDKVALIMFAAMGDWKNIFIWLLNHFFRDDDKSNLHYSTSHRLDENIDERILRYLCSTNWRYIKLFLHFRNHISSSATKDVKSTTNDLSKLNGTLLKLMLQEYKNPKVTQLLLAYGANPNIAHLNSSSSDNASALLLAIHHNRLNDIRLLLMFGAKPPLQTDTLLTYPSLSIMKEDGPKIDPQNYLTDDKRLSQGLLTFLEWYVMCSDNSYYTVAKIINFILTKQPGLLLKFITNSLYKSKLHDGVYVDTIFSHQAVILPTKSHEDFDKINIHFKINVTNQEELSTDPAEIFSQRFTAHFFKFLSTNKITSHASDIAQKMVLRLRYFAQLIADELLLLITNSDQVEYSTDQHFLAIGFANYGYRARIEIFKKLRLFFHSYYCRENSELAKQYQDYDKVQDATPINIEYFLKSQPNPESHDTSNKYYHLTEHFQRYLNCQLMTIKKQIQLTYPENFIAGVIELASITTNIIYLDLVASGIPRNITLVKVWDSQEECYIGLHDYLRKFVAVNFMQFIIEYEIDNLLLLTNNNLFDLSSSHSYFVPHIKNYNLVPAVMINILNRSDSNALIYWLNSQIKDLNTLLKPFLLGSCTYPAVLTTAVQQLISHPKNSSYANNIYVLKQFIPDFKQSIIQAFKASNKKFTTLDWEIIKSSLIDRFNTKIQTAINAGILLEVHSILKSSHPFQVNSISAYTLICIIKNWDDNKTDELFELLDRHLVDFDGNPREKLPINEAIKLNKFKIVKALLSRIKNPNQAEEILNPDTQQYEAGFSPLMTAIASNHDAKAITFQREALVNTILAIPKLDMNYQTAKGESALSIAIETWQPNIVKALLSYEVNIKPDHQGNTILHAYAKAQKKNIKFIAEAYSIFNMLIAYEKEHPGTFQINTANNNGITPILAICSTAEGLERRIQRDQHLTIDQSSLENLNTLFENNILALMELIGTSCFNDRSSKSRAGLLYFATRKGWLRVLKKLFEYSELNLTGNDCQHLFAKQLILYPERILYNKITVEDFFIDKLKSVMFQIPEEKPAKIAATLQLLLPFLIEKLQVVRDKLLISKIIAFAEQHASHFQEMDACLNDLPKNPIGRSCYSRWLVPNILQILLLSQKMRSNIISPVGRSNIRKPMKYIFKRCNDMNITHALADLYNPKSFIHPHAPIAYVHKLLNANRFSRILTIPIAEDGYNTILFKLAKCSYDSNVEELYRALKIVKKPFADTLIKYDLISAINQSINSINLRQGKHHEPKLRLQTILFELIFFAVTDKKDKIKPSDFEKLFEHPDCSTELYDTQSDTGNTLLHLLLEKTFNQHDMNNHVLDWVHFLVNHGFQLDKKNDLGLTPLYYTSYKLQEALKGITTESISQTSTAHVNTVISSVPTQFSENPSTGLHLEPTPTTIVPLFVLPLKSDKASKQSHHRKRRSYKKSETRQSTNESQPQPASTACPIFNLVPIDQATYLQPSTTSSTATSLTDLAPLPASPIPQSDFSPTISRGLSLFSGASNMQPNNDIFIFGANEQTEDSEESKTDETKQPKL